MSRPAPTKTRCTGASMRAEGAMRISGPSAASTVLIRANAASTLSYSRASNVRHGSSSVALAAPSVEIDAPAIVSTRERSARYVPFTKTRRGPSIGSANEAAIDGTRRRFAVAVHARLLQRAQTRVLPRLVARAGQTVARKRSRGGAARVGEPCGPARESGVAIEQRFEQRARHHAAPASLRSAIHA